MKFPQCFIALIVISTLFLSPSPNHAAAASAIDHVNILTPQVALFDRFEVQFDVATSAAFPNLPYDPQKPASLGSITGISVDALFTSPSGKALTQPAFFDQPYTNTIIDQQDHLIPSHAPLWAVRFTPQETGAWQFRLRATDASGTSFYPASGALTFNVSGVSQNAYRRKGFLKVSSRDWRYFEFQDGSPFIGVGYNAGFSASPQVAARMQTYEANKMDFFRVWMSASGIFGSQWSAWSSHHLSWNNYLPDPSLDSSVTYQGSDVSMRLDAANPCLFDGWSQGAIPVTPSKTYVVKARVKLANVSGPKTAGDYGFIIKTGGWLGKACDQSGQGQPATASLKGTQDWSEVSGTITTGAGQNWLGNLYLTLQNTIGGSAYIDQVLLYRQDDPAQTNILRKPYANSHLYFDSMSAAEWDLYITEAEEHGVYLKLVTDEKNEWILNRLNAAGTVTSTPDNNNFYAAANTKVRWLEQAWWRYIIARWGYSPAVHSFEYINEGDPYSTNHYAAANAMAVYFHQNDPSRHMVTTSFWHSFPNKEFWSNPAYSAIDYADIHAYISTGWGKDASFLTSFPAETRANYVYEGNASAYLAATNAAEQAIGPRGMVIQERGEWLVRYMMKAENYTATCGYGSSGGSQRVRWMVDGGPYWGGKTGIVPGEKDGKDFICTSPGGTYNWKSFQSSQDRDGASIPAQYRLVIADDLPHEIAISIENRSGSGGAAWIDKVELVSPSGKVVPVVGKFDITPLKSDSAWYQNAYGSLFGGSSPVGLHKPLVRGEGGIDLNDNWDPDLNKDTNGIWLHNDVWAQAAAGGIPDLMWWADQTIDADSAAGRKDLYKIYLAFKNFMSGIPVNNGHYLDAAAQTAIPGLRAWGQTDATQGKAFLWIQNTQHSWRAVVDQTPITPITGSITIPTLVSGSYRVEWYDTYAAAAPLLLTQEVTAAGSLVISLPAALSTDIAVKISRIGAGPKLDHSLFIPAVRR